MAKRTVKSKKAVITKTYTLELSEREATALAVVLRHVGGHPFANGQDKANGLSARGELDNVYDALARAGIDAYSAARSPEFKAQGSVFF